MNITSRFPTAVKDIGCCDPYHWEGSSKFVGGGELESIHREHGGLKTMFFKSR